MNASQGNRPEIRLAVLQMSRLSDNLQSLMALRAAKQLYPELEITFVAHEAFSEPARNTSWIDQVIPFPTGRLLAPILEGKRSQEAALSDLAEWIEPLVEKPFDLAINWSFNEPSSYLLGLLPARVKLGYSRLKSGEFHNGDGWSHYVQAAIQTKDGQGIHLTDILTTQLLTALQVHIGDPVDPGNSAVTSKTFFSCKRDQEICPNWNAMGRRWLAVHLRNPGDESDWRSRQWAEFLERILRRHDENNVILIGPDREMAAEILEHLSRSGGVSAQRILGRIVDRMGTLPFETWTRIISDAQWVVTQNSAAISLASLLGTRVFSIASRNERFRETGPYGNAHYVVENTSPLVAYGAWSFANTEWQHRRQLSLLDHFRNLEISDSLEGVQVHRSRIRSTEEGGGVHFEPLISRPITLKTWLSQAISHQARSWYCGWVPPIRQELSREKIDPELLQQVRGIDEALQVMSRILGEAARAATEFQAFAKRLKSERLMSSGDRARVSQYSEKLEELEALIHRVSETQPSLEFFTRLTRILTHNLEGTSLAELAESSVDAYRFVQAGVNGLQEWTQETLTLAKPAAVVTQLRILPLRPPSRNV